MKIKTQEEFDAFAQSFKDHSLAKKEWTHEAHFVAALWFLLEYGYQETVKRLPLAIKTFNEATGVPNTEHDGYHETITLFYLKVIEAFISKRGSASRIELLNGLLNSEMVDKKFPFSFYSHERLSSVEARLNWLEPDLDSLT